MVDAGGALPGGLNSGPVVIQIDSYSTDQEVEALAKVLAEKGPEGLRETLWDLEKGWIRASAAASGTRSRLPARWRTAPAGGSG